MIAFISFAWYLLPLFVFLSSSFTCTVWRHSITFIPFFFFVYAQLLESFECLRSFVISNTILLWIRAFLPTVRLCTQFFAYFIFSFVIGISYFFGSSKTFICNRWATIGIVGWPIIGIVCGRQLQLHNTLHLYFGFNCVLILFSYTKSHMGDNWNCNVYLPYFLFDFFFVIRGWASTILGRMSQCVWQELHRRIYWRMSGHV